MAERKLETSLEQDGFLGRWSRRKTEARHGAPLVEPPASPPWQTQEGGPVEPARFDEPATAARKPLEAPRALPDLADVQALTAESDFTPFMARGVAPGVRNAAMKKLFSDPHFNVMDGLDTYIDDYTKTSPLSAAMLKRMASAKFLGLLDDDEEPGERMRDAEEATEPETAAEGLSPDELIDLHDEARTAAGAPVGREPPALSEPREPS